MEAQDARWRAGRTESGAESEGVLLPSVSRGSVPRSQPGARVRSPVKVRSTRGTWKHLVRALSLWLEHVDQSFKASYLSYQVRFIADFATCDAAYSVLRYSRNYFLNLCFSRDFSSNCVENACLGENRSPVCRGGVRGCSSFIFFVIVRF